MKQFALTLCMVLLSVMFCRAQIKPLKFDKNGEFKIVQFTDVHFKYGNPASDIALKRINEVLDAERQPITLRSFSYIIFLHSSFHFISLCSEFSECGKSEMAWKNT